MRTPQLSVGEVQTIITANRIPLHRWPVVALAIRGYWLDSLGKPGVNDRGRYDDAHFLVWPDGIARFAGNTDPNGYREGKGTGAGKGMAMLKTGIHLFGTGLHKGKKGFRQAEEFTVIRDGNPPYEHKGQHAIDWHSGSGTEASVGTTSSLGCQTNPPAQWVILQPLAYRLMDFYQNEYGRNDWNEKVRTIPYILLEETERRKGNYVASRRFFEAL